MAKRVILAAVGLLAAAIVLAGILYVYGKPQAPSLVTPARSGQGEVPRADPSSPLAIEIPGCVCHSDDPGIVSEHAEYRMNQCAGCHVGAIPGMGG